MKIEKIIDNIDISKYIYNIEIIDNNRIKVIYEIPDNILKNTTKIEVEEKVYEHEYIPYPRKKTQVQNITGANYNRTPYVYSSRTDAAKAIGVNRDTLYSRIRKGKGKAVIQTLRGTFKVTAIEE